MTRLLVFPSKSLPGAGGSVNPTLQAIRDMAPNSWLGLPNTNPSAVTPSPVPPGHGPAAVIENWCGGVLIPGTPDIYCIWGGGHNGYAGNEVYGLDLSTFSWSLLIGATATAQITDCTPTYADGNPSSRHTYGGITHDNAGNLIWVGGGVVWCSTGGAGDPNQRRLNLPAGTWTDFGANYTQAALAGSWNVHRGTGEIWGMGVTGLAPFSKYVPGGAWTYYNAGVPADSGSYANITLDLSRDLALMTSGLGFFVWDLSAQPQDAFQPTITTGAGSLLETRAIGHEYRDVDQNCYAWGGGDTIQRYTPSTTSVTVTDITSTNSGPVMTPTGTFDRFRYWPAEDRFMTIEDYFGNVFIWRPDT